MEQKSRVCIKCKKRRRVKFFREYTYKNNSNIISLSDVCNSCRYAQKAGDALFWTHVIKKEGCWDWKGEITRFGYGAMRFNGKHMNAHRVSWIVHNGPVLRSIYVCHSCDNRLCTNPKHLFLGTPRDNMHDMIKKGRSNFLKGSDCPWAQLTESQILEMLKLFEQGVNAHEVARRFNIDRRHASDIKRGRRWGHVGNRENIDKISHNKQVLSEDKVREIKKRFKDGARICDIMKEFELKRSTVDDIKKVRTWKHVS